MLGISDAGQSGCGRMVEYIVPIPFVAQGEVGVGDLGRRRNGRMMVVGVKQGVWNYSSFDS